MRLKTQYPIDISLYVDKIDFLNEDICGLTTLEDNKIRVDISSEYGYLYVVHEIVHVIYFIEQYIESTIDNESKAYLALSLFTLILKAMKKKKKGKKKDE